MLVDGQAGSGVPSKLVGAWTSAGATFLAADSRLSYSHSFAPVIHGGVVPVGGSQPIHPLIH